MATHCYNCKHFLPHLFYCSFWEFKLEKSDIDKLSNGGCVLFGSTNADKEKKKEN
jgi:hypothetical protein